MTNLDIILKSRYITLPTKVHIVKSVVRTVKALMRVKEESEIAGLKPNIKKKKKKKKIRSWLLAPLLHAK